MLNLIHSVLHATAIKRDGVSDQIAEISGLEKAILSRTLDELVTGGRLIKTGETYLLTPAGRMILDSEYSRFYADLRADNDFINAYKKFEVINKDLKELITQWQTMTVGGKTIPNDHTDESYDNKIIDRLGNLHELFEPILKAMTSKLHRLSYYLEKLTNALEKSEDGDIRWVSDVRIDSYHTVWFELHEELLRVLGFKREE